MQGSIVQTITLTIHGNAFLTGAWENISDFHLSNSAFKFCEKVTFVDLQQTGEEWVQLLYAANPADWFRALQKAGVQSLRMTFGPSGEKNFADRMLVGFVGGGGRWIVETVASSRCDRWEGRWKVGDRYRADRKIWRVMYRRIAKNQNAATPRIENLEKLQEEFRRVLRDIEDFARAQKLDEFAEAFSSALSRLNATPPYSDQFHNGLAPTGLLSGDAARLLAAAQDAWVFGGMGSWNDMSFPPAVQPRYDELSERLYQLLNRGIVAAANSSAP